ncbi:MAG: dTDP-4-amino-4,6-dideoxygalactose transaminase, partial [Pseudohongiellaceae bacterium]
MDANNYIVFGKPDILDAEIEEVVDSLKQNWLGTGPKVKKFEHLFADYKNVRTNQVAAVNSCTAALHLSLLAADIKPGDEVITTAMTFCATVNAIIHAGATPVLVDILPANYNLDPREIERKITNKTKAIVPVHYSGNPCDMDAIMAIAEEHNLKVIEDCAHALESEYKGRPLGTFGDYGCFSFYATKNITTGEGGMVIGKSEEAISRIKTLALHGMSTDAWARFSDDGYKHYQVTEAGFKYNMMDLQAAIGIHQLARIDDNWMKREHLFRQYNEALKDLPVQLPTVDKIDGKPAYHLYPILLDESLQISRDQFMVAAHKEGVGTGVHYLSIPAHQFYRERFGWSEEDYPVAAKVGRTTVSLPFSPGLTSG